MNKYLYFLFIALAFFECDSSDPGPNTVAPNGLVNFTTHNSIGEFFEDIPVFIGTNLNYDERLSSIKWYVNNELVNSESLGIQPVFNSTGEHHIGLEINTNKRFLKTDTIITVIEAPFVFNESTNAENGLKLFGIYPGFSILYASNTGSSVEDYKVLTLENDRVVKSSTTVDDWPWYPEFGTFLRSSKGEMLNMVDNILYIYKNDGTFDKKINFDSDVDYLICTSSNDYNVLYDSSNYLVTKIVDIYNGSINNNSNRYDLEINDMELVRVFPLKSGFISYYKNQQLNIVLLQSVSYEGNINFTKYINGSLNVTNIHDLQTDGILLETSQNGDYDSEYNKTFVKVDNEGILEWEKDLYFNYTNYLNYIHGPNLKVIVQEGFIYLFWDNMRCTKISVSDGAIIWDEYFDIYNSIFHDVMQINENEFIMLGARQFDNENNQYTTDYTKRDLLLIKLNADGERKLY
jgi:hypothetical protein